jgi:hypothetical protein
MAVRCANHDRRSSQENLSATDRQTASRVITKVGAAFIGGLAGCYLGAQLGAALDTSGGDSPGMIGAIYGAGIGAGAGAVLGWKLAR